MNVDAEKKPKDTKSVLSNYKIFENKVYKGVSSVVSFYLVGHKAVNFVNINLNTQLGDMFDAYIIGSNIKTECEWKGSVRESIDSDPWINGYLANIDGEGMIARVHLTFILKKVLNGWRGFMSKHSIEKGLTRVNSFNFL